MKVTISLIPILLVIACHKPKACISVSKTSAMVNEELVFVNCSQNTHYGMWDFGDGMEGMDDHLEIKHTYKQAGTYTVRLTAHSYEGRKKADSKTVEIIIR